ncbi:DNA-binding transcriptional regulator, ArsR family [Saccharopolyspora kobensis]|uniref:Transcriptional regulator, ArsR family n=1 Tax=Saccharopolyspora kobensis TaxID=146035 RepID=A0A1H6EDX4_9PSEU|nr:helix-turn-helix transcriptional regulator [Saccharopolyspora kobensis]SEG95471.1 DNA-binding transcriptional regulator, ArsR family [Saccharopolyspora kobensis]SFD56062.1 transcriptional regulator, ArsR family [Saccharopolyspora kobensis]
MTRTLPQPGRNDLDILKVLHALADPVRLELLHTLSRETEPSVCSLDAYDVDVSAPTLSHHWRVLREAGLTTTFVNGRNRWVELRREDLSARFPGLLEAVLTAFEHRPS